MRDYAINIEKIFTADYWQNAMSSFENWYTTTLVSQNTLLEISIVLLGAFVAKLIAQAFSEEIEKIRARQGKNAVMQRVWRRLGKLVFPFLWLSFQVVASWIMTWLSMRTGLVSVVASLLTAWIVIQLVSTFVGNPIVSRMVAYFAWLVAAVNILGFMDETVVFLNESVIKFGELSVSLLSILQGIMALLLLLWTTGFLGHLLERRIQSSAHISPSFQVLSIKLIRFSLAVFALVFASTIVGVDLTAFAVLGGAIGVGLGFGLQKIFANLISGFILLVDKSIKPGDVITVADDYGKVNSLGARYVSVLTRDGIEHLIPNEELITSRVENWSHSDSLLRLHVGVGVHYKSDVHLAMSLCKEAMSEVERILNVPIPNCLLREFGDNSVNLEMRFWISDPMNGRANVTSDLLLKIWDKFHEHDIEIPYPQRDLHIRSDVRVKEDLGQGREDQDKEKAAD